jgi:DNA-binding XRE family transcriptional regulator
LNWSINHKFGCITPVINRKILIIGGLMDPADPVYTETMIIPAQVRAARAWLGWTRAKLAAEAGVSAESVRDFEIGRTDPRQSTLTKIEQAFREAGVELFEEPGGRKGVRG